MNNQERSLANFLPSIRKALSQGLPQLAKTSAKGLVPLSIGIVLVNLAQGAPSEVINYLAGLAPNFLSDMLLKMHRNELPLDPEAIAEAVTNRLDEPGLRRLAEELQLLPAVTETIQAQIQSQTDYLKSLANRFQQELEVLKSQEWPVQNVAIDASMTAIGQYIAQARDGSISVILGDNSSLSIPRKKLVRILIGNATFRFNERRSKIIDNLVKLSEYSLQDYELIIISSQSASIDEARFNVDQNCDIYVGFVDQEIFNLSEVLRHEILEANRRNKLVLLYAEEPEDQNAEDIVEQLRQSGSEISLLDPFATAAEWGEKARADLQKLLSSNLQVRTLPVSGRRGLIASLGRSPGAITGLYFALEIKKIKVDYVWTVSTSDRFVKRAGQIVREALSREQVIYQDFSIPAPEIESEVDVLAFKQTFSQLLIDARLRGDAVAIGVTGGRTVMGALLTQVAQMEAPANSAFYQLSVPDDLEEDGRYPYFESQTKERQIDILNPTRLGENKWRIVEISLHRFFQV